MAFAPQVGDRYDLPESRAVYENDIIDGAAATHSADTDSLMADSNPFIEHAGR